MPRPLNWIRGEGTVKNQRWGLGSDMDTPMVPQGLRVRGMGATPFAPVVTSGLVRGVSGFGATGDTAPCPGSPGCPGYVVPDSSFPDVEQQIADVWDYVFTNAPVNYDSVTQVASGNTVGAFVVKNWMYIAAGLVGVALLGSRR